MSDTLSQESNTQFSKARWQAFSKTAMAKINRQARELLPFDKIRSSLHLAHTRYLGLQDVELDKIAGSAGRYDDFTREFLPRRDDQQERWRRIYDLTGTAQGFPPVDLYKVGDVYFVRDGNHRVSVARANKAKTIEASVTEYQTPVELTSADTLDDILIKSGQSNFLQATHLDRLRPDQDIRLTNPGRYKRLLADISRHKYFKELECSCEISCQEAVVSWYDKVYMPLINEIRARKILKRFPGRTEADLYTWLVLHRAALEKVYGMGRIPNDDVVEDLAAEAPASPVKKIERAIKRRLNPGSLPPPVD